MCQHYAAKGLDATTFPSLTGLLSLFTMPPFITLASSLLLTFLLLRLLVWPQIEPGGFGRLEVAAMVGLEVVHDEIVDGVVHEDHLTNTRVGAKGEGVNAGVGRKAGSKGGRKGRKNERSR